MIGDLDDFGRPVVVGRSAGGRLGSDGAIGMKFSGTDVDAPPTNRTKFRPDRASRFRHVRYRSTGTGVAGRFSRPVNGFASMFRPNGSTHDDAVNVVAYVSSSSRIY